MTWQPTFSAQFVSPIIDNLLGAVRTQQTDALAWANGEASTFQSRFSAGFIEPVVLNLLANVELNMEDALAWVTSDLPTPPVPMLNDDDDPVFNDDNDPVFVS